MTGACPPVAPIGCGRCHTGAGFGDTGVVTDSCAEEGRAPAPGAPASGAGIYPFGRRATRRAPRQPDTDAAAVFVLGVHPGALHVRWSRPNARPVPALAVEDEPSALWTGRDQTDRIATWRERVGWRPEWGAVGAVPPAGPNGGPGRLVVTDVLEPLGLDPRAAYATDCVPTYLVQPGERQDSAVREYDGFAAAAGLPASSLRRRPDKHDLVRLAVRLEGPGLLRQLRESDAPAVVTLGREAADVFAALAGVPRVPFRLTGDYGATRPVHLGDRELRWTPLVHPGAHLGVGWRNCHARWVLARRALAVFH